MIHKDMTIEELVTVFPPAIDYLLKLSIKCIRCGEPIWETLEQAAKSKGFTDNDIKNLVQELDQMAISVAQDLTE